MLVVKAAGVTVGSAEIAFADSDQISFWAKVSVLAAVNADIMTGYPDNTFRPQCNATRAGAICVILNPIK
ncbi:MAG: S-layer homology domain-containing protein [Eubacteriales bacterium]|nr:S-layer homology domain-containing protein [Eubacteriales bacterium]